MESDKRYFARRAAEERAAAAWATHEQARSSHLAMASRYHDLANAIERRDYVLGLDLFGS